MKIKRRIGILFAVGVGRLLRSCICASGQRSRRPLALGHPDAVDRSVGSAAAGEAIGLATALEVATTPFGTSSAGFVFKLDPATGLRVRTATTFGPSFAERALTSGEGKVSASVSLISASYQKLGDLSLEQLRLGSVDTSADGRPRGHDESQDELHDAGDRRNRWRHR